jgi:hypothetical protein
MSVSLIEEGWWTVSFGDEFSLEDTPKIPRFVHKDTPASIQSLSIAQQFSYLVSFSKRWMQCWFSFSYPDLT